MKQRIVIVGGGYGGVHSAQLLSKKFRKNEDVEITLIDRNPYHTLMTELHEIAGSRTEPGAVQINFERIFGGSAVRVVTDEVETIDFEAQELHTKTHSYPYEYLILGTGGNPEFYGTQGVQENSFTLWSLEDALRIREHVELQFRKAAKEEVAAERKRLLTFAIAGAGFTGVELAGELVERADSLCRDYHIDRSEVRILVIEAQSSVLPVLNPKSREKAARYLKKKGVEVVLNAPIVKAEETKIWFMELDPIQFGTFIWTCGVQASDFTSKINLTKGKVSNDQCSMATPEGIHGLCSCHFDDDEISIVGERGRLLANDYLQSVDYKNVYLVGDVLWYVHEEKVVPQIVETALQSAETVSKNILASIRDKEKTPFRPVYHGFMVSIGSHYAVANVMGLSISGFFAMATKHLINLHYLWGVAGINACWSYVIEEFFAVKERRSVVGGHASASISAFWTLPLRIFLGFNWVSQSVHKLAEGWLQFDKVRIPGASPTTTGSSTAGSADATAAATTAPAASAASAAPPTTGTAPDTTAAATAATSATAAAPAAGTGPHHDNFFTWLAGLFDQVFHWLIPDKPWPLYQWFAHNVLSLTPFLFQTMIVFTELGIGLALLSGTFTFLAAAASIGLGLMFVISGMTDVSIYWYMIGAVVLMGGAGRVLGLDYWILPFLKKIWTRIPFVRRHHLYFGEPLTVRRQRKGS